MSEALVTNYDEVQELKGQIIELRKQLDETIHLNQAVSMLAGLPTAKEMDTLVKDGKRLDWLQSNDLTLHSWEEGDVWGSKGAWTIREFIDREME
jgi:Tfp pilus assembly protein PilO